MIARIAAGVVAGIVAGVIAGLGARLAMRLVALGVADGVGITPEFTIAGTLAIALSGAIAGAPFGAIYAVVEERLRRPARARGLMFATLMLVFLGPLFFSSEEFFSTGRLVLFLTLFPIYGLALGIMLPIAARIARRMPIDAQRLLALIALAGAGLVLFGLVSLAGQAFERHGIVIAVFVIPWLTLALIGGPALRARLSRFQVAR